MPSNWTSDLGRPGFESPPGGWVAPARARRPLGGIPSRALPRQVSTMRTRGQTAIAEASRSWSRLRRHRLGDRGARTSVGPPRNGWATRTRRGCDHGWKVLSVIRTPSAPARSVPPGEPVGFSPQMRGARDELRHQGHPRDSRRRPGPRGRTLTLRRDPQDDAEIQVRVFWVPISALLAGRTSVQGHSRRSSPSTCKMNEAEGTRKGRPARGITQVAGDRSGRRGWRHHERRSMENDSRIGRPWRRHPRR